MQRGVISVGEFTGGPKLLQTGYKIGCVNGRLFLLILMAVEIVEHSFRIVNMHFQGSGQHSVGDGLLVRQDLGGQPLKMRFSHGVENIYVDYVTGNSIAQSQFVWADISHRG